MFSSKTIFTLQFNKCCHANSMTHVYLIVVSRDSFRFAGSRIDFVVARGKKRVAIVVFKLNSNIDGRLLYPQTAKMHNSNTG